MRIPAGTEVSRTPGRSVPEAEPTRAGNGGARAGMCVCRGYPGTRRTGDLVAYRSTDKGSLQ